jgi:hypothetical protein
MTNSMLGRLGVVYGVPDSPNPKEFLNEYSRLLQQYTDSELQGAADQLLAQRKFKTWPTIAECIGACEDVRAGLRTRIWAEREAHRKKPETGPAQPSFAEQEALERFVDDCADGKIDMGLCAKPLREMAITMRARRKAKQGNAT